MAPQEAMRPDLDPRSGSRKRAAEIAPEERKILARDLGAGARLRAGASPSSCAGRIDVRRIDRSLAIVTGRW